MANIKDLKVKIKSTKGTLKITTAMKLVSAAKMAKAQQAITNSRPYASELEKTIKTVSALAQGYEHDFLKERENKFSVLLVISSDKGLCGGYNAGLSKEIKKFLASTDEEVKVYFIGKKVRELLIDKVNEGEYYKFEKGDPSFAEIQSVANKLSDIFKSGEVGKVYVAYNVFKSAISNIPTVKQVLPISMNQAEKDSLKDEFPFDFKYEPSAKEILDTVIPETYVVSVYTCLLDAKAAEHGSRMSAMDNASKNCKDAIRTLTLKMNKLRQAAITTELIEVVSGAESLKG